jgi:DNA-binding LytR/AlgR family response regulator
MVRNTLRSVSEQLKDKDIIRCHRSYMINIAFAKVLRREKDGLFIELDIESVPTVPISRTYSDNIRNWMEHC